VNGSTMEKEGKQPKRISAAVQSSKSREVLKLRRVVTSL
jgi:hypothetical protein